MWNLKDLLFAVAMAMIPQDLRLTGQQIFPNATYPSGVDPGAGLNSRQSPPFYPSPWMTGQGEWADAYEKARAFVSQLTLLEKVNLTTGVGWEGGQCVGEVRFLDFIEART